MVGWSHWNEAAVIDCVEMVFCHVVEGSLSIQMILDTWEICLWQDTKKLSMLLRATSSCEDTGNFRLWVGRGMTKSVDWRWLYGGRYARRRWQRERWWRNSSKRIAFQGRNFHGWTDGPEVEAPWSPLSPGHSACLGRQPGWLRHPGRLDETYLLKAFIKLCWNMSSSSLNSSTASCSPRTELSVQLNLWILSNMSPKHI